MRYIFSRLSQRIHGIGAAFVTFFAFLPALASANPGFVDGVPTPIAEQGPTLTLISPVEGASFESTPAGPEDILARLRRGFELQYADNNRTDAERRWYIRHQDYLTRVFTRSQRYMPHIVAELERRDLPLELALALLTDSNGVIQMDVPVSGDVNDPEFSVGSVIAGAFINLITKAVTAPFKLLANLIGSEEDLQRINFAIGTAALDDAGRGRLDQLNEALSQRPQLTLLITGRLNVEADRTALQQQALRDQLLAEGISEEDIGSKSSTWEKSINKRYKDAGLVDGEEVSILQKYDAVAGRIDIPDQDLLELAEARAVAVKSYLVNEAGLAPDRAVIAQGDLAAEENTFSGAELGL